jgi:hypothetical protein
MEKGMKAKVGINEGKEDRKKARQEKVRKTGKRPDRKKARQEEGQTGKRPDEKNESRLGEADSDGRACRGVAE